MVNKMLRQIASAAGYELIEKWRMPFLPIATKVATLLNQFAVTTVLDVGANEGQYRDFLRKEVGFSGQIYSFEPDPKLAEQLVKRADSEDPCWKVFPVALGRSSETRQLNRMTSTPFNSFLEPISQPPATLARDITISEMRPVEVRRLDDMATKLGDLEHAFVKIDTQGFDLEVLAGGQNVIQRVPVLQTEISIHPIYQSMPTFLESITEFQKAGFDISDLFLVISDENFRALEFDCIMVRSRKESLSGP